jgi:hypothetical protein
MDHTFGMLWNYSLIGRNYVFTWAKGTRETVAAAIVPSTSMEQASHLVEQVVCKQEKGSNNLVNYTHTWPANKEFFKMLLGPSLSGNALNFFIFPGGAKHVQIFHHTFMIADISPLIIGLNGNCKDTAAFKELPPDIATSPMITTITSTLCSTI